MISSTKSSARILVVHPEAGTLQLIKERLDQAGFRVHCEVDSLDAMRTAQVEKFALIITNLELPNKISGFELIRVVRMATANSETPVIFITRGDENREYDRHANRLKGVLMRLEQMMNSIQETNNAAVPFHWLVQTTSNQKK